MLSEMGSPPRGRGKVPRSMIFQSRSRITPAWAGKRLHHGLCIRCPWDHPRVGGEKSFIYPFPSFCLGSPPRGRGKGRKSTRANMGIRITPAWAGKSECRNAEYPFRRDHPRVGGEKLHGLVFHSFLLGSPPRGRGKVPICSMQLVLPGITPAWAGKRRSPCRCRYSAGDHPRVGGEKAFAVSVPIFSGGSPPRGRGKVDDFAFRGLAHRITPAWAGKSRSILP